MSEETQFWGVAVERYGQGGRPTHALSEYSGITPENKPFRGYRVFSSRERADQFVQGQWQTLSQELIEQTVANIRQIRRDETPADHYVSLERVMNSIRNGLGMRETENTGEPSRLLNPHFYAIFAQVHNTL